MSNANDSCAYCGRVRANLWHRVTSDPGTHAFVEPAPQPAPSGDEAKVRELARAEAESIATRWVPAHMTARQGMVDDITASLVRYRALGADAGKADGAREATDKAWEWVATVASKEEADECREFIARRGSEGT